MIRQYQLYISESNLNSIKNTSLKVLSSNTADFHQETGYTMGSLCRPGSIIRLYFLIYIINKENNLLLQISQKVFLHITKLYTIGSLV